MASCTKKKIKAQQARRHRSYIKEQLKTVLEGVEDIPQRKGTDFLITTLVKHASQWKTIYYTCSEYQEQETNIQRRNDIKEKVLTVLKDIEGGVSRDVETDFDSLVEILVNHSKYLQQNQYIYNKNIYMETEQFSNNQSFNNFYTETEQFSSNQPFNNFYTETEQFSNNQPFNNFYTETEQFSNIQPFESEPILDSFLKLLENDNYTATYQPPNDQNYFQTELNNDHQSNNENYFQTNPSTPQETNQETVTIHHQEEQYQETNENNITTEEETVTIHHQEEQYQETNGNNITTEEVTCIKHKRKRTTNKSKHVCDPEKKQKRFRKTIDLLIKGLDEII